MTIKTIQAKYRKNRSTISGSLKSKLFLLLLMFPLLSLVFVFYYLPLAGWSYAFVDYIPGIPLAEQNFVGLKYFKFLFSGMSEFSTVIRNTLVLSFLRILSTPIPIIFAIMLTQMKKKWFSKSIQTIASIPNFISWVIVYSLFFILFSSQDGIYNKLLMSLGIIDEPTNILGNGKAAWYTQTFIGIWKWTGWEAIIYISAMSSIDPELYFAADVDGANRFQKILHVTIPGILPTFFVILLLTVSNMLSNGFDQYYVFQNPVVIDKLEVFDTYIYRMGILNAQYAFATAMGCFKSIISLILLTFANGLSKVLRGTSII